MTRPLLAMAAVVAASWTAGYALSHDPLTATVICAGVAPVLLLASVGAHTVWQRTDHSRRLDLIEQRLDGLPDHGQAIRRLQADLPRVEQRLDGECDLLHGRVEAVERVVPLPSRRIPRQNRRAS